MAPTSSPETPSRPDAGTSDAEPVDRQPLRESEERQSGGQSAGQSAVYRRRVMDAVSTFGSYAMVCALLSGIVQLAIISDGLRQPGWQAWLAANSIVSLAGIRLFRRMKRRADGTYGISSRVALRAIVAHAVVSGLCWAALPWIGPAATFDTRVLEVGLVAGAMTCVSGFALGTVPAAAGGFIAVVVASHGTALAMSSLPAGKAMAFLLALFGSVVMAMAMAASKTQHARTHAEIERRRQHDVIGLLLKDFEENSSDLLWEITDQGTLVEPSARLRRMLRIASESAHDIGLIARLERNARPDTESRARVAALQARFDRGEPFRDHVVCLQFRSQVSWWSITAKPVENVRNGRTGWRGVMSDITDTRTSHNELLRLALECSLTGLANRHRFLEVLNHALVDVSENRRIAVLLIDLDNFKRVNDTHGHNYGDGLLRTVASRLRSSLRPGDLAARLGGDEFAVLLNNVLNDEEAARLAGRILARAQEPAHIDGLRINVGLSIGIAVAPRDGQQAEDLMRSADIALYAAKADGKGALRVYSHALGLQTRRKRLIEEGLRHAIADGSMHLVFQPQISFARRDVVAFEALARWTHPDLGAIPPAEFIPVAEETGQIATLGTWVLVEACRAACSWPDHIGVAVNVSVAQAIDDRLLRIVSNALQETGLHPGRLEIEITESIILDDDPRTMRTLHELRAMGTRIALDDFGVGFSSLAYLRKFPFDSLKIDRAFNGEITTSEQARAIVQAIVRLATCLGMTTIAEGIEFMPQADVLAADGCDLMQGFLFSKPLAHDDIPAFIARWNGTGADLDVAAMIGKPVNPAVSVKAAVRTPAAAAAPASPVPPFTARTSGSLTAATGAAAPGGTSQRHGRDAPMPDLSFIKPRVSDALARGFSDTGRPTLLSGDTIIRGTTPNAGARAENADRRGIQSGAPTLPRDRRDALAR